MNSCVRCVYRTRRVCSLGDSETFLLFPPFFFSWRVWILPLSSSSFFLFTSNTHDFPRRSLRDTNAKAQQSELGIRRARQCCPTAVDIRLYIWQRFSGTLCIQHGTTTSWQHDYSNSKTTNAYSMCIYPVLFALSCTYLRLSASVIARCLYM